MLVEVSHPSMGWITTVLHYFLTLSRWVASLKEATWEPDHIIHAAT